ncbi:MAG: DUF3656 domain-containing protein, partial [Methanobacteriaceae archaeon]|nr:DUF3656 domain-containing protein [Methanobacteriaceae archaeon]
AFAQNFSLKEIKESVNYAHLNGVKVHVTVNTLIYDSEIVSVLKYVFSLFEIGVDAVIIQDIGLAYLINLLFPELTIHASTQMTLGNYNNILWAFNNGFSRVILPREISIDKINSFSSKLDEKHIDLELEVFGHGALCYSVSGDCLISSFNSNRSGNRGFCAQPCRKEYNLKINNNFIKSGNLLSTHDLSIYNDIDSIIDSGVSSIKLEGRMKSVDYVVSIVNAYHNILDNNSYKDGLTDLSLVFNRGFTGGYLLNNKPSKVMDRKTPGHDGLYIGKVVSFNKNKVTIKYSRTDIVLENGDGLAFNFKGNVTGLYVDNILEQNKNKIVLKVNQNVIKGSDVFISYSKSLHDRLKSFKNEQIKSNIPLSINISWDNELCLFADVNFSIGDNILSFNFKSKYHFEKAVNRPVTVDIIKKQLSKTGETPFYIDNITIDDILDNFFISIKDINSFRRDILDKSTKLLLDYYKPSKKSIDMAKTNLNNFIKEYKSVNIISKNKLGMCVFIDSIDLLKTILEYPVSKVYFDPSFIYSTSKEYFDNIIQLLEEAYKLCGNKIELVWVLSSFISDEDILKCKIIVDKLYSKNINISVMGDSPCMGNLFDCKVYGNSNLNVSNSFTVDNLINSGFNNLIISPELNLKQIQNLISHLNNVDLGLDLFVYGNLEVMLSMDDFSNLKSDLNNVDDIIFEDCNDNSQFKVLFDYNGFSHFLNSKCLCLVNYLFIIKNIGVDNIVLDCRFLDKDNVSLIVSLFLNAIDSNEDVKNKILKVSVSKITTNKFK